MSELSPEARAIVDAAEGADDPTADDKRRVRSALAGVLAGGAAVASSTAASSAAAAVPGVGLAVTKLVAGLVVVGAVGATLVASPWEEPAPAGEQRTGLAAGTGTGEAAVGGESVVGETGASEVLGAEDQTASEPTVPGAASEIVVADPTPTESRTPRARSRVPAQAAPPTGLPVVAPPPAPSPLQLELGLLRQAQAARRAQDPQGALRALAAHQAQFPQGALTAERQATQVLVLCELGRQGEAREIASVFLASHPGSPLAERVRRACGGL